MIYTELTKTAIKIMYEAHKDRKDKSGLPYVFHPWHVAESMEDEECTCAALLHDVIEDTDMTIDDLRNAGIPEEVLEALVLLTHEKGKPYMEYVRELSGNRIARRVKLSDLTHNMDITRLDEPSKKDIERLDKYRKAKEYLEKNVKE